HDVPYPQLGADLNAGTVPEYSLIVPDLCHDGHDETCISGEPGGLAGMDAWSKREIPKILASPAFQQGGVLFITFDEAQSSDTTGGSSSIGGGLTVSPANQTRWHFAEGTTRPDFSEFLTIENAASSPATASITYFTTEAATGASNAPFTVQQALPPTTRT